MEKLSRGISERMRRNSGSGALSVDIDLDINDLEYFLLHLSKYTDDADIASLSKEHFTGLSARFRAHDNGSELCLDELNEVITMLSAFLGSAPGLPSNLVAQVHSYVGLIREKQQRHTCAIRSLLKALWIQTSTAGTPLLEIAITENRLGLAYGMSGNYPQAISLLEKAIDCYVKMGVKVDHPCMINAQAVLSDFRSRHLQLTLPMGTKRMNRTRRLTHIDDVINEDREYFSERFSLSERF
jgi:tetratricopeptide (TPR) repeat protein